MPRLKAPNKMTNAAPSPWPLTFPRLSPMKYLPAQRIEDKEYRKCACRRGMFSVLGPTIAEDRQHARARYCTTLHRDATPRHPRGPAPGARGGGGRSHARTPAQSLAPGTGARWNRWAESRLEAHRPADRPRPCRSGSTIGGGRHRGTIEDAGGSSYHRHRLVGGGSRGRLRRTARRRHRAWERAGDYDIPAGLSAFEARQP